MDWFESTARGLISTHPYGYTDTNWIVKKNEDEYFVKWTNNKTGYEKQEWLRYLINNEFDLLSFKLSWFKY
jgi:hypothetical protein